MHRFEMIGNKIKSLFSTDENIQLHRPRLQGNEQKYVSEAIANSNVSSAGTFISKFEDAIKATTKAKHVVLTSSGTSALHIALLLAGVEKNDEVLTQSLSFVATSNAISYCGATPVFLDVDLDTFGMSPRSLIDFLKKNTFQKNNSCFNKHTGNKISVCVPMHTFGFPLRIDEIVSLCDAYGIKVVEDAAQGLGSTYKNKHVGTIGTLGILSFNGNKMITSGGGGCILTNDASLAKKARFLINQAKDDDTPWETSHSAIGFNYRMPNLNAALGFAQIEQLDDMLNQKKELHKFYMKLFNDSDAIHLIEPLDEATCNNWLQTILFDDPIERGAFLAFTHQIGIQTRAVWRPLHQLPMYNDSPGFSLVNTEFLASRLVNLPSVLY